MRLQLIIIALMLLFTCTLYANSSDVLIAIVKTSKAKVRDRALPEDKYIVEYYHLGDVFYLDYCDKYDWCKIKDKQLYISKATLGVMEVAKPRNTTVVAKEEKVKTKKQPSCIPLTKIHVNENEIFDENAQTKLLSNYLHKCITSKLLKDILHTTAQYYIGKGYITTKPYLQQQNIKSGTLKISIAKGYLQDVLNSETNASDGRIATAFAFQKGKVLNLRDLETALEMMNRVPSYHSTFKIKPAAQAGASIVTIKTEKTTPYRLTVGAIGEKQDYETNPYLNADFSIDNLLNINDIVTLRYNGSKIQSYYQSSSGSEVDYSFPISSYLFSYTWFRFKYSQRVLGINDTYRSNGDTVGSNLKVSKILNRNQNNKLEAAFSLQYKNNKNYFSNELIDVSSYKTTLAQVDIINTYFQHWGQMKNILSYYRGTNWLGARSDGSLTASSDEKLQFNKFSLDTNLLYSFAQTGFQINSNFHLQYTKDLLYDNNKLRVGSYYTVRGYAASYYGNNAYYLRNDFIKIFHLGGNSNFMQSISPFIGLDYGAVRCEKNTQYTCGSLYGSAIGIKTGAKNLDTEFTLSRGLKHATNQDFQNLFRYSVVFKY